MVGPAASVGEALNLLEESRIDGAILDCKLRDGEITPIAEALLDTNVPVVLHTGGEIPPRLEGYAETLPLFHKPIDSFVLARRLAQSILDEQNRRSAAMFQSPQASAREW